MNWYKFSQSPPVVIASWTNEGVVTYIDGKRYFCKGFKPKEFNYLNTLIKNKAWGKAKNVIRNWPCESEEIQR